MHVTGESYTDLSTTVGLYIVPDDHIVVKVEERCTEGAEEWDLSVSNEYSCLFFCWRSNIYLFLFLNRPLQS